MRIAPCATKAEHQVFNATHLYKMALSLSPILQSLETAALDQHQWRPALNLMAETFHSTVFAMRTFDTLTPSNVVSDGGDHISAQYFAGKWDQCDLRAQRFMQAPERRLISDADLVEADDFQRSEFYRGFANPYGLTHLLAWRVDLGDRSLAFASNRSQVMGPMSPDERAALSHIVTPASAAAVVASHLIKARNLAFLDALTASGAAAIILGQGCAVLAVTPAAEQFFAHGFGLEDHRLVAFGCSPNGAIAELRAAVSARDFEPRRLDAFTIGTSAEKVLCLPLILQGTGCDVFSGARALLILRSLKRKLALDKDGLVRLFGLTASQAEVASLLAEGNNPAEIALKRQVSTDTVRAMLKAAFAKTGARSQAELVALVLRVSLGIAH